MNKPLAQEYPHYYSRYINLVEDMEIVTLLDDQKNEMLNLLNGLGEEVASYRYESDKWSIKEVIGHIIDVERIFAYRLLRIARNDKTPLAEFDQEEYVLHANFDSRTLIDLSDEFLSVRESTLTLCSSFDQSMLGREGIASGLKFTVRSIPFIIAGHEIHHRQVINQKYLSR